MSERLDELVGRLAAAAPDRSLDDLETDVWRTIRLRQRDARTVATLAPLCVASIGLALAMGITVGSATAAAAIAGPNGLSSPAHLAPSNLLESGR